MPQPNVAQMQNQYMQTGQFQGSNPVLGAGSVDMAHPGNDSTVTQVREHRCSLNCIIFLMYSPIMSSCISLSKHVVLVFVIYLFIYFFNISAGANAYFIIFTNRQSFSPAWVCWRGRQRVFSGLSGPQQYECSPSIIHPNTDHQPLPTLPPEFSFPSS